MSKTISVLQAKIRNAVITASSPDYKGSITIDEDIMDELGVLAWQECHVNGGDNRAVTYIIPGPRGSKCVEANGALSNLFHATDIVHVNVYCSVDEQEARSHEPIIIETNLK